MARGPIIGLMKLVGGIYEHQVIVHQENFVDPDDRSVHTQNVEKYVDESEKKTLTAIWNI
jgi:hypothetical protein